MPSAFSSSSARMASVAESPNLERYPPEDFHLPEPRLASLTRSPMVGRTPTFWEYFTISPSSVYFSTTGMICRPIFWASMAISMYSSSLKPLQTIGVSLPASAITAISSGLEPASRPKL